MGIHILNYDKQILGQNADLGHVVEVCYGLSLLHTYYIYFVKIFILRHKNDNKKILGKKILWVLTSSRHCVRS